MTENDGDIMLYLKSVLGILLHGWEGFKVSFNGEYITENTFHKYATMYIGDAKHMLMKYVIHNGKLWQPIIIMIHLSNIHL